ncbi:MAG: NifU family protein [Actinomycetota bacterium]
MEAAVRRTLELKVRPAVRLDGGDIELVSVLDGVVTIRLIGACEGCPMSPVTLRAGVERILREEVPNIREVIALED